MIPDDAELMAMFPLGTVLFPKQLLPLQVFEPRYRAMIADVSTGARGIAQGVFGVTLIERGSEVGGGDTRASYGCLAHIVQTDELPDGRIAVVASGGARIEVVEWLADDPYPRAVCRLLADTPFDAASGVVLLDRVRGLLIDVHATINRPFDETQWPDEIGALADAVAYRFGFGAFDAQRVLQAVSPLERLEIACSVLGDALEDVRLRRSIEGDG